jgi:hypothetical protein
VKQKVSCPSLLHHRLWQQLCQQAVRDVKNAASRALSANITDLNLPDCFDVKTGSLY